MDTVRVRRQTEVGLAIGPARRMATELGRRAGGAPDSVPPLLIDGVWALGSGFDSHLSTDSRRSPRPPHPAPRMVRPSLVGLPRPDARVTDREREGRDRGERRHHRRRDIGPVGDEAGRLNGEPLVNARLRTPLARTARSRPLGDLDTRPPFATIRRCRRRLRMTADHPAFDVDTRVEIFAEGANLAPVADTLETRHDEIVDRWLRQARRQPFHRDQAALAVADHIPALLRAIAGVIRRGGPPEVDVEAPLDDDAVARAAAAHAQARFEQGLGPVAIATEFRLLRQEISAVLIQRLDDSLPASDVVSSLMVVSDALDGATILALAALTERIETLREEFLANTLHDVRQPITVVEGSLLLAARWLARPTFDTGQLVETIDGALLASQELSLFVDALSDASQLAMASLHLDREPVPASEVVGDAIAALPGDQRSRVRLVDRSDRAIGDWDRRAVRRVLRNLLSNAIKYSPRDTPIDLLVEPEGSDVHIAIADRGIGFADADLAVLFQRYGRSDTVRAAGFPGLGLGLYACRGLVEGHQGRIWLDSPGLDQGTTAHVRLPMLREEPDDH